MDAANYMEAVTVAFRQAGYRVAETFIEGYWVLEYPDYVIRLDVGGPIVDLIWDAQTWNIIVHPYPHAVANSELSQQLCDDIHAAPGWVVRLATPIIGEALRRWGPTGWTYESGDGWQRYEKRYGGGVTGVVYAVAAGIYTGSIRRPIGCGLALGTNYGFPHGHVKAQAAVDAMYEQRIANQASPYAATGPTAVADSVQVRRADLAHRRSGYVCKRCGGPSPIGIGYASDAVGAYERSVGRSACECGHSTTVLDGLDSGELTFEQVKTLAQQAGR